MIKLKVTNKKFSLRKEIFAIVLLSSLIFINCSNSPEQHRELEQILQLDEYLEYEGQSFEFTNLKSDTYFLAPSDTFEAYYFDGHLKQLMQVKNGVRHGIHLEFDENGELYMKGQVVDSKNHGIWETFGENRHTISAFYQGEKVCDNLNGQVENYN